MDTVKIIKNGGSQAVRIPARYRIRGTVALIKKIPGGVAILEKSDAWVQFQNGLDLFSDDFFKGGRDLKSKR
ncbi:MAG: AbrB/MazE/SpoVT family DNA-binding domain-containing protein [Ignavibacteriales bacterium]|nr:AbrB/MazE/SpoVT family DNA-binding domain-containing protein [Ignavibacteriales bacterium]